MFKVGHDDLNEGGDRSKCMDTLVICPEEPENTRGVMSWPQPVALGEGDGSVCCN